MTAPVLSRAVDSDPGDDELDQGDLAAGLHVFRAAAPLDRAGTLASRMGADLCATLPEVAVIVAERRALPLAGIDTLDSLRDLARRVAATERIAHRTHERAAAEVADRVASVGGGLAVHPSTIRERSETVLLARGQLHQAEQLLEANQARDVTELLASSPEPEVVEAPLAPEPTPTPPKRRPFGFLRRSAEEVEDTSESTELLRAMGAATDEAFGARRALAASEDQRILLEARRDTAAEVVRVAERAWHELAGADADPTDPDEVVRRFDPQHQSALLVAQETVSVRAASVVFDAAMGRWQAAWSDLSLTAPIPAEAVESVDRLLGQITKAVVLVGVATERGLDVAEAAPSAPVVAIEALLDASV